MVVLNIALQALIAIVDVLTCKLNFLVRPDRLSAQQGMSVWQSLMVNIVVMPILSVPQVMDWNPHGHDAAVYVMHVEPTIAFHGPEHMQSVKPT